MVSQKGKEDHILEKFEKYCFTSYIAQGPCAVEKDMRRSKLALLWLEVWNGEPPEPFQSVSVVLSWPSTAFVKANIAWMEETM